MITKKTSLVLFAATLLALCGCQTTSTPSTPAGKVVVTYDHPENFTDVKASFSDGTEQGYLDDFSRYIVMKAGPKIAADQTLTITFTDIDMAGEIGMHVRANDVRVIRSNYPVRLDFTYAITDAAGKVVKQGKEELVNNFPATQTGINRNDVMFHEKDEMDSWIRSTLR